VVMVIGESMDAVRDGRASPVVAAGDERAG
jgi:hypothetical protein